MSSIFYAILSTTAITSSWSINGEDEGHAVSEGYPKAHEWGVKVLILGVSICGIEAMPMVLSI